MRAKLTLLFALIAVSSLAASAQFTIEIPKLPKIKKEKPQPNAPTTTPSPESIEAPTSSETGEPRSTRETPDVCKSSPAYGVWLEDMKTTLREAEEYKPGLRDYYVQDFNDRRNKYLEAAISPSVRREWFGDMETEERKCFIPVFDAIAAAAKKTLPTYHATSTYVAAGAVDRKLMLGVIEGVTKATIFKVALAPGTWEIGKDSYNFPVSRYKYGEIWLKWPNTDDGFCRIFYVNIVQDYAGGGRYGGSYARHVDDEPAGCPAGK